MEDRPTAEVVCDKLIQLGYEKPFRDGYSKTGIPAGSDRERELDRKLRLCGSHPVL